MIAETRHLIAPTLDMPLKVIKTSDSFFVFDGKPEQTISIWRELGH